ncbi:hypothetical protein [Fervidobacterium islandicum]|uniref:hypothetical protein n=1 Tax=Fervidobacterium islandicum TaxID=2423 RepID=UPI003A785E27
MKKPVFKLVSNEEFLKILSQNLNKLDYSYAAGYRHNVVYPVNILSMMNLLYVVEYTIASVETEKKAVEFMDVITCPKLGICTSPFSNDELKHVVLGYIIFTEDDPIVIPISEAELM